MALKKLKKRYKLIVAYDGTDFGGWQVQAKDRKPTIAGTLQKAFMHVFNTPIIVLGTSRTDAGVHAMGQVATFTTTLKITHKMVAGWQNALPSSIVIRSCKSVDLNYNPFIDIQHKIYWYHFFTRYPSPFSHRYGWRYPFPDELDIQKLKLVLKQFEGTHNFRSLCTGDEMGKNTTRTIDAITLKKTNYPGGYRIIVTGQRFMRHMIRRIVGAALQIASHANIPVDYVQTLLAQQDPNQPFVKAPARGLTLRKIVYKGKRS